MSASSPDYHLTDAQWLAIEPLLPSSKGKKGGQYKGHRPVIDGILWALSDGGRWRNMPAEFGPWSSVYDRFRRWARSGVWAGVLDVLRQRKAEAGGIDERLFSIDGSVVRAHVSAAGAQKKVARGGTGGPRARAKPGRVRHEGAHDLRRPGSAPGRGSGAGAGARDAKGA
jgi:transposase